jgi:hypothetical protein
VAGEQPQPRGGHAGTPRTRGGRKNKTSIPIQPNQKKENPNSKSPLLPKLQTPISRTKRDPTKLKKKIKKKICNQLHQQPIRNPERHSEIRRNPASKSGKTQPQNQILMLMWRKETMGLQVLAREKERIRESA